MSNQSEKLNLQFMTIASGSTGNATLVRAGSTSILVDVGIPRKVLRAGLSTAGLRPEDISAFVITHAHHDHTKHLQKAHNSTDKVPIFGSKLTLRQLGKWADPFKNEVKLGGSEMVGPIRITPIELPHDEPGCFGYMFSCEGRNLAFATDFGKVTGDIKHFVRCAHAVLIETNYDDELLQVGTNYSSQLKTRIAGPKGHLSNAQAAELISESASDKLHVVCCAHISQENNTPRLAVECMADALQDKQRDDVDIIVAFRDQPGPLIEV